MTFCGAREHKTTAFILFSWTLIQSFIIQLQKKLPTFDGTERDGISTIKFDTFRLQSLSRSLRGEFFLVLRDFKEERRKKILSYNHWRFILVLTSVQSLLSGTPTGYENKNWIHFVTWGLCLESSILTSFMNTTDPPSRQRFISRR